jgi:nucleotide-binding universal stress UspA family protein
MTSQRSAGTRILVPLDDSVQAQRVLAYVQVLAARSGGELKLIRATDVEDETSFNSLEQHARRLRDAGFVVDWTVTGGVDAETAILSAEAAWQPDLIALASMKASRFDRWLNGSVSEHVVAFASAPVLLVPPAWDRPIIQGRSTRVVVPLDGSSSAEQALWVVAHLIHCPRASFSSAQCLRTPSLRPLTST